MHKLVECRENIYNYVKKIEFEKPCIKVKIRIDSVYEGEKYEDTCITSIFTPGTISEP